MLHKNLKIVSAHVVTDHTNCRCRPFPTTCASPPSANAKPSGTVWPMVVNKITGRVATLTPGRHQSKVTNGFVPQNLIFRSVSALALRETPEFTALLQSSVFKRRAGKRNNFAQNAINFARKCNFPRGIFPWNFLAPPGVYVLRANFRPEAWAHLHEYLRGDQLARAIADDRLPFDPACRLCCRLRRFSR